ncbi:MAG: Rrf2 family transcriptional regulator [Candidatus Omnitrophica bacterium]|nr:Rrf2 family transcriptional regulator [Candidatus Omnitrophota bacterium]MCM8830957.1 Rrf2 family transcriptional regulator [Candidatus Omnitrophota bacterium]
MRISAEIDYACRALLELALNWSMKKPVKVSTIAKNQDIPLKYLEQILFNLKKLNLIQSVRGKEGGYILAKEPSNLSMGEVIQKLEGHLLEITESANRKEYVFTDIWRQAEESIVKLLDKINFEDIAKKVKNQKFAIVYQI